MKGTPLPTLNLVAKGSGGAATSDPLLRSSVVVALLPPWSRLSVRRGCSAIASQSPRSSLSFNRSGSTRQVRWNLWQTRRLLYELWCKAFNQERDHAEMARRFSRFKQTVLSVDSNQKSQPVCPTDLRLEITSSLMGK